MKKVIWWAVFTSLQGLDALEIVIDRGNDNPIPIAVVPFASSNSAGDISGVISFDLIRSGQFSPIEKENMLSYPSQPEDVYFRDWRVDGGITVAYRLFDVSAEREVKSGEITAPRDRMRDIAHRIADDVYEEITGIRGAFSTRILYVLVENIGTSYARYKLEMADSDGERPRTLFETSEPLLSPSWSPDGQRIAYVSFETGRPAIVIQELESNVRQRLPSYPGLNSAPAFSPDGRELAMVLSRDGNPEIYTMEIATPARRPRRVTRHLSAIDTEPAWTPDGKSLIFTSDRGGRPQIYRVDLRTSLT